MKKVILIIALFCSVSLFASGMDIIGLDFSVGLVVKTGSHPQPKSPETPPDAPEATLEDNVLTFTSSHDDYTLTLLDEDSEVAYQTVVPSSVSVVVLPATLSGDYELQLDYGGNYYFYCEIAL